MMIYYLSAILWTYLLIFTSKKLPLGFLLILSIPLILFSTYRGTSGADTINYIYAFRDINFQLDAKLNFEGEPVVYLMMLIASKLFMGGLKTFYLLYASLFCVLFCKLLLKHDKYKVFLYTIAVVFVIDGLTNTLRVSLAYLIYLNAKNSKYYLMYYFFGFMTHVSIILMILFEKVIGFLDFKFNLKSIFKVGIIITLLGFLLLIISNFSFLIPRVSDKIAQYEELSSISKFSGLSDIAVIALLLALASVYNRKNNSEIYIDMMMLMIFCVALYSFALTSIASYRVFKIMIITITISPFLTYPKRTIPERYLIIIGLLYTLNYIRIIMSSTAYFPYGGSLYELYNMHNLY